MKKLVFKKWVENLITWIAIITFILLVSINDVETISGLFIIYGTLISVLTISLNLLSKYGRCFK